MSIPAESVFPAEIWSRILWYLEGNEILQARQVCRAWRKVSFSVMPHFFCLNNTTALDRLRPSLPHVHKLLIRSEVSVRGVFLSQLRSIRFIDAGDEAIVEALSSPGPHLTSLLIDYSGTSPDHLEYLFSALTNLRSYEEVGSEEDLPNVGFLAHLSLLESLAYRSIVGLTEKEMKVLATLKTLTSLHLYDLSTVSAAAVFTAMTQLRALSFSSVFQLSDRLCWLSALSRLEALDAGLLMSIGNFVAPPLPSLTSLVARVFPSQISALTSLHRLTLISPDAMSFTDQETDALAKLTCLSSLSVDPICDLNLLQPLTALRHLSLSPGFIIALSYKLLHRCTSFLPLESLEISIFHHYSQFTTLGALANFTRMTQLRLHGCLPIPILQTLTGLTWLRSLSTGSLRLASTLGALNINQFPYLERLKTWDESLSSRSQIEKAFASWNNASKPIKKKPKRRK